MSRMELDAIQSRLMAAIQNHQILVSKIKLQPQVKKLNCWWDESERQCLKSYGKEMTLKIQLQQLQKEILLMSQQQTHVVKKLRQELVERKTEDSHKTTEHCNTYSMPVRKPESRSTGSTPRNADIQLDTSIIKRSPPPLRIPNFIGSRAVSKENTPTSTKAVEVIETKFQRNNCHNELENTDNNSNERAQQLKQKLDFMASIDLVPPDSLKELSSKRSERKRRSTNNPNFAYGFELLKRPKVSHFQASDYFGARKLKCSAKPTAVISEGPSSSISPPNTPSNLDFPVVDNTQTDTKENKINDNCLCTICGQSGQVVMCKSCRNTYHPQCLSLPVTHEEQGNCLRCQDAIQKSALSLSVINAYISRKTGKEEEKKKLLKRNTELHEEMTNLEYRKQQVNDVLTHQAIQKQELMDLNQKTKQSVENLKSFVKRVQSS